MAKEIRERHIGDTLDPIKFTLKKLTGDAPGTLTSVDFTGLSAGAVKIKMFNAATKAEVVALTATGVSFTADDSGDVEYDFSSLAVPTAGYFWPFFVVTVGGETTHYPIKPGDLQVELSSDTQTAEQAYLAAC